MQRSNTPRTYRECVCARTARGQTKGENLICLVARHIIVVGHCWKDWERGLGAVCRLRLEASNRTIVHTHGARKAASHLPVKHDRIWGLLAR